MRLAPIIVGILMIVIGAVWTLQGINTLQGSPMSGQPFWAYVGGIVLILGLVIVVLGWRRATRPRI